MIDLTCAAVTTLSQTDWFRKDLAFAQHAHSSQVDKAGQPYWTHVERVAFRLVRRFPDATADQVRGALLHDSVEDTKFTGLDYEKLLEQGYSPIVVEIVRLLNRNEKNGLSYLQAMRVLASSDDIEDIRQRLIDHGLSGNALDEGAAEVKLGAIKVKLSDNEDNSDPIRIAILPAEKQSILTTRYRPGKLILEDGLTRMTEHFANSEPKAQG